MHCRDHRPFWSWWQHVQYVNVTQVTKFRNTHSLPSGMEGIIVTCSFQKCLWFCNLNWFMSMGGCVTELCIFSWWTSNPSIWGNQTGPEKNDAWFGRGSAVERPNIAVVPEMPKNHFLVSNENHEFVNVWPGWLWKSTLWKIYHKHVQCECISGFTSLLCQLCNSAKEAPSNDSIMILHGSNIKLYYHMVNSHQRLVQA